MRRRATKVVILLGVLATALVTSAVVFQPASPLRRPCGHLDESFRSVDGFKEWVLGKPHHCTGGRVMLDLALFQSAQGALQKDLHRPATDLTELAPYAEWVQRRSYPFRYAREQNRWSLAVDRTSRLPGFYLLTMEGKVYFAEWRPATTNDLCLKQMKVN